MKQILFALVAFTFFSSCNNEISSTPEKKDSTIDENNSNSNSSSETSCFAQMNTNDTLLLNLTKNGDSITGSLYINRSGKDANRGTISGTLKGDTLFADYLFMSEGIESVREVAFLKKGDAMIEGYGDVEQKGNKIVFKKNGTLKFNERMLLSKVSCQ
jgi:hypothetical protein